MLPVFRVALRGGPLVLGGGRGARVRWGAQCGGAGVRPIAGGPTWTAEVTPRTILSPLWKRQARHPWSPLCSRSLADSAAPLAASVHDRVMQVLRAYDKVDPQKITLESHFLKDLGLDSLDQVELIMGMEDEFGFEIPDADAEKLLTANDVIAYVTKKLSE